MKFSSIDFRGLIAASVSILPSGSPATLMAPAASSPNPDFLSISFSIPTALISVFAPLALPLLSQDNLLGLKRRAETAKALSGSVTFRPTVTHGLAFSGGPFSSSRAHGLFISRRSRRPYLRLSSPKPRIPSPIKFL
jgi:hypothetical protein